MKFVKSTLLTFVIRWILLTNAFLVVSVHSTEESSSSSSSPSSSSDEPNEATADVTKASSLPPKKNGKSIKFMSLAETIKNNRNKGLGSEKSSTTKDQWEQALQEIKNLAIPRSPSDDADSKKSANSPFRRWRSLLDEPTKLELDPKTGAKLTTPRFEGFASWERTLQDWADDVQEYMEKIELENKGYPMSTFGNADKTQVLPPDDDAAELSKKTTNTLFSSEITEEKNDVSSAKLGDKSEPMNNTPKKSISLPVPSPRKDGEDVVPHTDIGDKSKKMLIVTTAALPWMTGTAVNPLLRAAYMTSGRSEAGGSVTLMLPWLERRHDQVQVYGSDKVFENPEEQEVFIRKWLRESAKLPIPSEELQIKWYTAWQNKAENSVYSMGDITALIPEDEVDICILEEPEHLNWYRAPGDSWTDKFKHVVGIIHTNYFVYAQDQPAAFIRAPAMRLLCSWMCRAHCHRIVKLSGTLGQFAPEKELIENVHGIRASFLDAGSEVSKRIQTSPDSDPVFGAEADASVYFIGKMLWSKGIGSLMELLQYAEENAGIKIQVDMYGGGPDKDAAESRAKSLDVDMVFHGPIDHAELAFTHKIFINPSTSEVLCTTVAEALGMGKFVVIPSHPSNDFFTAFPNCLVYSNKEEFVGNLYYALTHSPEPLTAEYSHALSWEAATQRLEAAGSIPVQEAKLKAEALSSNDAGIEISLPPLIEDVEGRKVIASGLRRSRARYRMFRSRLSQEVSQSNVLPNRVKQSLMNELDKRLDLDIDVILQSPKLRLELSPAELDKKLLELYNNVADGPSGDVLRIVGGGNDVALQDFYVKRKRYSSKNGPLFLGSATRENQKNDQTASQWVNSVLKRNLPKADGGVIGDGDGNDSGKQEKTDGMKMCLTSRHYRPSWIPPRPTGFSDKFCVGRTRALKASLLI
mmetsp:Transcript_30542/g.72055  ORF Transcript_30542/g.72055 Transcript_30542/m.72055 type:complete len:921 (-) Transcript_30542:24-2786(-)